MAHGNFFPSMQLESRRRPRGLRADHLGGPRRVDLPALEVEIVSSSSPSSHAVGSSSA